ncbi:hypothetical protein RDV89_05485 [Nocardioides zeae]|uniref:Uncharacterized protein n=1 Tax=Nocardioides imazamoxiresistens TaxID=3231893 RepID=A0ABU3PTF3_9ACTN|nr:hypothetical protein [Nocardioides zeae]MDT9592509.1 hypothetical protein [Nocardioides zeae]
MNTPAQYRLRARARTSAARPLHVDRASAATDGAHAQARRTDLRRHGARPPRL